MPKTCIGTPPLPELRVDYDRPIHCTQQILFFEGFLQEVHGTVFHGANAGGYVAVGGDEDDGCFESPVGHAFLKSEAIHARHLDIEHNTSWLFRGSLREIGLSRVECFDGVACGTEQSRQRRPNTLVVVDHVDRKLPLKGGGSCAHSDLAYG